MIGTTLAHFKITDKLGEGGMGEVYRAEDTKLGRQVAIKVLPDAVANDPERLARFEREAKVLAALNHPHVAAIYSIESALPAGRPGAPFASQDEVDATLREPPVGSAAKADVEAGDRGVERQHPPAKPREQPARPIHFLVMELVEGEDLSSQISARPLSWDEAQSLALQISEGLEAAHEQGIVHRDLKPANIRITPEGQVKILDFGLAKAWEEGASATMNLSMSPTITANMTQAGVILGTAAYMSPEQAKGKPADKRTDIWAFGVIVWEMLTGETLFGNKETVSEVLAGVLTYKPELTALEGKAPQEIQRLLGRCLEPEPRERLRDIGEARIALENPMVQDGSDAPTARHDAETAGSGALARWIAALLIAALASFGLGWWLRRPAGLPAEVVRFEYRSPDDHQSLAWTGMAGSAAVLSPDGQRFVYVALGTEGQKLYLRELDGLEAQPIAGTTGASQPFFSPDGQWIGFTADRELRKIPVGGGTPMPLALVAETQSFGGPFVLRGAVWGPDDTIVFANPAGLFRVSANGGQAELILDVKERDLEWVAWPQFLPDGRRLLFTQGIDDEALSRGPVLAQRIAIFDLESGDTRALTEGGSAQFIPTGHLLFGRSESGGVSVYAAPFDVDRGVISGPETILLSGVSGSSFGEVNYSVANNGTLAYRPGSAESPDVDLLEITRDGTAVSLVEAGPYQTPRISPDGTRIAVARGEGDADIGIWVLEISTGVWTRLTFESSFDPVWTPDGSRVVFSSARNGIAHDLFWKAADGSGNEEPLHITDTDVHLRGWIDTGRALLQIQTVDESAIDLAVLDVASGEVEPLSLTPKDELSATTTPDGQLFAWESDQSGRGEIYLRPTDDPGGVRQVSMDGGNQPVFGPDGRELFYVSNDLQQLMRVTIETSPSLKVGAPQVVFRHAFPPRPGSRGAAYSVHPDGDRFVMTGPALGESTVVVLNWFEEWNAAGN